MQRRFLLSAALASLGLVAPWRVQAAVARAKPGTRLLSARANGSGAYAVSALDAAGYPVLDVPLRERGHGMALHPGGREAVCLARRPGDYLLVLDLEGGAVVSLHRTPEDHYCCGHGVFSSDGALLYTTENSLDGAAGQIGVWDATDGYRRVGELPSYGMDPHELLLSADGEALMVANGGILTRIETGRAKLNLDSMAPTLVLLDRRDGRLLEQHQLAPQRHQLSIRHLARGRDGIVCVALQFEGPPSERPPLIAFHRPGQDLELAIAPTEVQTAMRNYCGSVAADRSGDWFAVSAPRGNLVTFWGADGCFKGHTQVIDGCGVAPGETAGSFLISSGTGTLHRHDCLTNATTGLPVLSPEVIQWDNHLAICT